MSLCRRSARPRSHAASGYVVVEKEDVVLAVGHFLSVYLASDPRAAGMTPKELQKAIK